MGYSNQQKDAVVDSGYDEVDAYLPEVETVPQDNLVYRIQSSDLAGLYHTVQTALDRQAYEDDVDGNDLRAPGELLQPSTIYVSAQDTWGNRLGGGDGQGAPRVYYAELRKLLSAQDQEKARIEAKKPGDKGIHCLGLAYPSWISFNFFMQAILFFYIKEHKMFLETLLFKTYLNTLYWC